MTDLIAPTAGTPTGTRVPTRRPRQNGLLQLWRKAHVFMRVYLGVLALILVIAMLAPLLAPYDPNAQTLLARLKPPIGLDGANPAHVLGTDQLGRDIYSRTLHGLQLTLVIAFVGSFISLLIGVATGIIAGYVRGPVGAAIMAVVDIQIAVPFTLIALLVIAVFGNSLPVLIGVIGIAGWESYARIVRAQVLSVSRMPFVEAAIAAGASDWRILFKHVLPNVASPIIVVWTMTFSAVILLESSLSFLGLGVQPPTATLGSMVGMGRDYLASHPWIALVPSVVIMFVSLLVLLIGDWLRDALDVKLK